MNIILSNVLSLVIADRNDCINVTCQHGGTCQDRLDSYTCECSSRYTGTHCEQSKSSGNEAK